MSRFTGYEIVEFGGGLSAYGFGVLEQWGYIAAIPEEDIWQGWDVKRRRQWAVDTNKEITRRHDERAR